MTGYQLLVRPPGGAWGVLGRDLSPGVVPEGLTCTADQAGPRDLSFSLARDTRVPWPDLTPFTDIEVHTDTAGLVWGGRVWQGTPGARDTIGVTARGWQYLLDDTVTRKTYVRNGTQGFTDIRTGPGGASLDLSIFRPESDFVATAGNVIQLTLPAGSRNIYETAQVILDLGDADAKQVSITWDGPVNGNANVQLVVQGYDDAAWTTGGLNLSGTPAATSAITADGTHTGTFTTAKRYVGIGLQASTTFTLGSTVTLRVLEVKVSSDTTWVDGSGVVSLLASDVVTDLHGDLPWVDADTSLIDTTATAIPHLTTEGGYETPRQVLARANAYHDNLLGVDALKRVFFRARPATPLVQIGDDTGATYADAGDSGDSLYNEVVVTGTQPDGAPLNETRTATSPLLDLNGYTRTMVLTNQARLTQAAAQVIGDAWLERRKDRPTAGSVTINGPGAATMVTSGATVHPAELLRYPGELIRVGDRWSPDDGANARDGVIAQVSWNGDDDSAQVTLDTPRDHMDVVLTRFAALQAARPTTG